MAPDERLLEVNNLKTYFFLDEGIVRAVDGVSFTIRPGQTLGVVGESGCGKSITGRSILRIVDRPGRIVEGQILFHRRPEPGDASQQEEVLDLVQLDENGSTMRAIRGGDISMVFQEPMTSFSPVLTIGNQIMEGILIHLPVDKKEAREIAIDMLQRCGLPRPHQVIDSYPWELSGGMRQRAMIARALVCRPSLLIADEPTTALDVTTETQILQLMQDLQEELGMAIMFITHDLGVIAEMAQEVIVMYLGQVVERASVLDLFQRPKHPYTQALLQSIPRIDRNRKKRLNAIRGMVPSPFNVPPGCPFHTRCPQAIPGICNRVTPRTVDVGDGHLVNCVLYDETIAHHERATSVE
ncbi:ABC transporter ATP-binding protein [Litorilinea aerophila]|uniref:ABC transporter ATP-binding protein n=1 Tax=Litorilinea aerophila TaxID=1204385 RepID=A0A540VET0_9CHLR|nr:ABC transporter ATP-binding protein [Litorilinea aerophila]MCC9077006.1 ABC transporter ATP-binding protein [Litorilinea aerophila]GIV76786.1 MAG: dipeptide/oligopeptide/nickel ABC transporter ATP-binding protein [Litorilinea sp.]